MLYVNRIVDHSPVLVTSPMGVLDVLAEKYELIVLRRSLYAEYVARNGVCSFPF